MPDPARRARILAEVATVCDKLPEPVNPLHRSEVYLDAALKVWTCRRSKPLRQALIKVAALAIAWAETVEE